jgi:hypothetical protein
VHRQQRYGVFVIPALERMIDCWHRAAALFMPVRGGAVQPDYSIQHLAHSWVRRKPANQLW